LATEEQDIKSQHNSVLVTDTLSSTVNGNGIQFVNGQSETGSQTAAKKTVAKPAAKKTTSKQASKKPAAKAKKANASEKQVEKKTATAASKRKATKKTIDTKTTRLIFQLRFHTKPGESLFILGNHPLLGNNDFSKAVPMQFLNEASWVVTIDVDAATIPAGGIEYNYFLKNADNPIIYDWGQDKILKPEFFTYEEILISDAWNHAGYYSNAFYTEPFQNVLLKNNFTDTKIKHPKNYTHLFKIKAPLLKKGETVCLLGSAAETGGWDEAKPVLLCRKPGEDFHCVELDLSKADLPLVYKYGVYDVVRKKFLQYEEGNNRILFHAHAAAKNKITIANDGFIALPDDTWKGAGVSIPVFSLRSKNSWGVGEFTDIKLLVDWAKKTGLQLIQLLPVNDTNATSTWLDSYPYAAISAFALHPMYVNPDAIATEENKKLLEGAASEKEKLNSLDKVDYEAVNQLKWKLVEKLFHAQKKATVASKDYKNFFDTNRHWLIPYAAFCHFRDLYKTADFNLWKTNKIYKPEAAAALFENPKTAGIVLLHCFVQYHLHLQLQDAAAYAHENGVIIKGDIPIGIYRYGVDAWQSPALYHMDMQAGAPPDGFTTAGQNWGFPTYNWEKMEADGYAWWRNRFEQMSYYFDAFRIDHILGFFRIWSVPIHSVEGIMGHFEPAIPVHVHEFNQRNIWFDYTRFTRPFINEQILQELVGNEAKYFKENFLAADDAGNFSLREEFSTQRKVETHFQSVEASEHNKWVKQQLFNILSNVILFEVPGTNGQQFHFRFAMDATRSFQYLDQSTQDQLKDLYVDYFFRRQDNFWMKEAMKKLPALKHATNMLVCGEDLGLVPGCVPEVMRQLGLLSLEIQRMPKQSGREFFHPNDAPYLSVVTPSTHDMSTIRGWWEEDRAKTQRFFNYELGQWGDAPYFCEPWVNRAIVIQHLYSPAMWSIFQIQDILGMSKKLRRENPHEERINNPPIPKFYWRYRMHLLLEDLLDADEFNEELHGQIQACGRIH
jgi:4-alpha-glucanotransferase